MLAHFFELLRNELNITDIIGSHVHLKQKGAEYTGLCPFHKEKTPSFTINRKKRFYYCFGCHAHGDVIKFFAEINGISYKDSAIKLAYTYNISVPEINKTERKLYDKIDLIRNVLELACAFFRKNITKEAKDYLNYRKIEAQILEKHEVGFAPGNHALQKYLEQKHISLMLMHEAGLINKNDQGNIFETFRYRIIFPIRDKYNKLVGFGGRTISQNTQPKYLNSPETLLFKKQKILYGESTAINAAYREKKIFVVEGYMDCITMQACGFPATVATLGTAVTESHLLELWKNIEEIVICLDGDEAGIRASKRIVDLSLKHVSAYCQISFILIPKKLDPDEFLKTYDSEGFQKLVNSRMTLSHMIWYVYTQGKQISGPEQRAKLEHELNLVCKKVLNKELSKSYYWFFRKRCWQLFVKCDKLATLGELGEGVFRDSVFKVGFTALDNIEYSLMAVIIQDLRLFGEISIRKSFVELNFVNDTLRAFKDYLREMLNYKDFTQAEDVVETIKNSRFKKIYQLLSRFNSVFLDRSVQGSNIRSQDLWLLLLKKHHLACLQMEYESVSKEDTKRASSYQLEIIKIQQSIHDIIKSLID